MPLDPVRGILANRISYAELTHVTVFRKSSNGIVGMTLEWKSQGNRQVGRPKIT